jgi:hypothetical protein
VLMSRSYSIDDSQLIPPSNPIMRMTHRRVWPAARRYSVREMVRR